VYGYTVSAWRRLGSESCFVVGDRASEAAKIFSIPSGILRYGKRRFRREAVLSSKGDSE